MVGCGILSLPRHGNKTQGSVSLKYTDQWPGDNWELPGSVESGSECTKTGELI